MAVSSTACRWTLQDMNQARYIQHAATEAHTDECWAQNKQDTHIYTHSPVPTTTYNPCSLQQTTSHSPHRAVRPGAYLFEPRVFLRDFPHRAVDFLTGEMCLCLHVAKAKANPDKTSPVRLTVVQRKYCSSTRKCTSHLTSVWGFQNNGIVGVKTKQLAAQRPGKQHFKEWNKVTRVSWTLMSWKQKDAI